MQNEDVPNSHDIEVVILVKQRLLRECLTAALEGRGMQVSASEPDAIVFQRVLADHSGAAPVVVLTDVSDLLGMVQDRPEARAILISNGLASYSADECLRAGAWGFVDSTLADGPELASVVEAVAGGQRGARSVGSATEDLRQAGIGTSVVHRLTLREREVLEHIAAGEDNLKIASQLGIAERTVKAHVSSLYRKLGQENRAQLALFARQLGLRPAGEDAFTQAPSGL